MNTETLKNNTNGHKVNGFSAEEIGDEHISTGLETPMKIRCF